MKKIFGLLIVFMTISLGFTACDQKGGTVRLINDTNYRIAFQIKFSGVTQMVDSAKVPGGKTILEPSDSVQAVSDEDTNYAVYGGSNSALLKTGTLSGGETVVIMMSDYSWY